MWSETGTAKSKIVTLLNDLGALDFHVLSNSIIFEWLVKIEALPSGMPHSNVIEDLNLSPEDLNRADENLKRHQEETERNLRSVDFGIVSIDSNNFDSDVISNLIKKSVKSIHAASKLGEHINLSSINQRAKPKPGAGGGSYGGRERISPQKKELIGFIGEYVVYHWLKKRFPSKDIDRAWVSGNRQKVLPGMGNDSVGCDFVINYRNKKWHLEVKSSMGDPLEFEIGETEVSKARDCARSKSEEYYIIYVSNLSTLSEANIEQLPNPMNDNNKNIYKLTGEGLKYKFLRS